MDELYPEQSRATDPEERRKLLRQFEKRLYDEEVHFIMTLPVAPDRAAQRQGARLDDHAEPLPEPDARHGLAGEEPPPSAAYSRAARGARPGPVAGGCCAQPAPSPVRLNRRSSSGAQDDGVPLRRLRAAPPAPPGRLPRAARDSRARRALGGGRLLLTRGEAGGQEGPLGAVVGEIEGPAILGGRFRPAAEPAQEIRASRGEQMVRPKRRGVDLVERGEPGRRAVRQADGHRAVERDHR